MSALKGGDTKKAMERLRVPPMKEHIQKDSNIHAILIFLGRFSDQKSLIGALRISTNQELVLKFSSKTHFRVSTRIYFSLIYHNWPYYYLW